MDEPFSPVLDEEERLLKEISEAEIELHDILQLNYDIVVENRNKDLTINKLNELLRDTMERNESESDQLLLEDAIYGEEMELDIMIEERKLSSLRSELVKLEHLESQNLQIKSKIQSTSNSLRKRTWNYAETIHHINKNIRDYREELEQTLKKELLRINNRYQNAAYASLDKSKKRSLLQLTMLRDEIALQDFGKSSLSLRYLKQEQEYRNCAVEYSRTQSMLEKGKENLSKLYVIRKRLQGLVERAAVLEQYILSCKEEVSSLLHQKYHDSNDIFEKLEETISQIRLKEKVLSKWSFRIEGLKDLHNILYGKGQNGEGIDARTQAWSNDLSTHSLNTTIFTTLKRLFQIQDLYQIFTSVTGRDRYNHLLEAIDDEMNREESKIFNKSPRQQTNLLKDILFDATILWAVFHIITLWECNSIGTEAESIKSDDLSDNKISMSNGNSQVFDNFKRKCFQLSQSIRKDLSEIRVGIISPELTLKVF